MTENDLMSLLLPVTVEWPKASGFTGSRLKLWHTELGKYREHEVRTAVSSWIATQKFAPKLSELCGLISDARARLEGKAADSIKDPRDRADWSDSVLPCERLLEALLWQAGVQRDDGYHQERDYTPPNHWADGRSYRYLFDIKSVAEQACAATLRWAKKQSDAEPRDVISRGYGQVHHMAVQAANQSLKQTQKQFEDAA